MATQTLTQIEFPNRVAQVTSLAIAWGGAALLISPTVVRLFGKPMDLTMAFYALLLPFTE